MVELRLLLCMVESISSLLVSTDNKYSLNVIHQTTEVDGENWEVGQRSLIKALGGREGNIYEGGRSPPGNSLFSPLQLL